MIFNSLNIRTLVKATTPANHQSAYRAFAVCQVDLVLNFSSRGSYVRTFTPQPFYFLGKEPSATPTTTFWIGGWVGPELVNTLEMSLSPFRDRPRVLSHPGCSPATTVTKISHGVFCEWSGLKYHCVKDVWKVMHSHLYLYSQAMYQNEIELIAQNV